MPHYLQTLAIHELVAFLINWFNLKKGGDQ